MRLLVLLSVLLTLTSAGAYAAAEPAAAWVAHVDSASHRKFGLYYPATYRFSIPPGVAGLSAQYRYAPDGSWTTLPEKTAADLFNGIDAVRFDYPAGYAYISVRYDRSSDDIFIRVTDTAGQPVKIAFDSIPRYYDGRRGAVTITLDDWALWADSYMRTAVDYAASLGLYFSVGLIARDVPWASVQQKIDQHGDRMEIASHTIRHSSNATQYAANGYDAETTGSRDLIRANLSFRAHPYVPLFIEPSGYSDASLEAAVTAAEYLLSRSCNNWFPSGSTFAAWNASQQRYGRGAIAFDDYNTPDDPTLLAKGNSLFDQAMGAGGIYHLTDHPWRGLWHDGSYLLQHLDYIKGRPDLWYVPFGQMYEYHFLQEMRGGLTIQPAPASAPVASFSASPVRGEPPLTVTFTDTSTGTVTAWSWDFGDGATATDQNPRHVYTALGAYAVRLTVTGPDGTSTVARSDFVTVTPPAPVAAFTASPLEGTAPLTVAFADTSTGAITGRLWEFGDGTTGTEPALQHVYTAPGSYTVKLTVTGGGGNSSVVRADYVKVSAPAPVAGFTAVPQRGLIPLTVTFTDTSTGTMTGWQWDFGDGGTSSLQSPQHLYTGAGSYTVKLTVTGPGGTDTKTVTGCVTVVPAPPVAAFSASPRKGKAPLTVAFSDASSGAVTGWLWDFGDGTTGTGRNETHTYLAAGSYAVKLTVTGPGGTSTKASPPKYIQVTASRQ